MHSYKNNHTNTNTAALIQKVINLEDKKPGSLPVYSDRSQSFNKHIMQIGERYSTHQRIEAVKTHRWSMGRVHHIFSPEIKTNHYQLIAALKQKEEPQIFEFKISALPPNGKYHMQATEVNIGSPTIGVLLYLYNIYIIVYGLTIYHTL